MCIEIIDVYIKERCVPGSGCDRHESETTDLHFLTFGIVYFSIFWLQVASGQVASTGMVALSYVQKVCEKVRKFEFKIFCNNMFIYIHYAVFFYLGFSSIRLNIQLHVKRCHGKCWLWLHPQTSKFCFLKCSNIYEIWPLAEVFRLSISISVDQ